MDENPVAVTLVARCFQAFPGQIPAIGAPSGVHIVAHHAFGNVAGLSRHQIVNEDVRIGTHCVFGATHFFCRT